MPIATERPSAPRMGVREGLALLSGMATAPLGGAQGAWCRALRCHGRGSGASAGGDSDGMAVVVGRVSWTGGVSKGTVEVVDSAGTGQSYWSEPQKEYPGWRGGARPRSVGVFVVRFGRVVVLEPVPGAEPYSD